MSPRSLQRFRIAGSGSVWFPRTAAWKGVWAGGAEGGRPQRTKLSRYRIAGAALVAAAACVAAASAQSRLVNMIPQARSGETNQDAEPTLAIDPRSTSRMAGSAFTWDNLTGSPMSTAAAPVYVSTDRGARWTLAFTVPSRVGAPFPTGDITLSFGSTPSGAPLHPTSWLYAGILSSAAAGRPMTVLRTPDYLDTGTLMTTLDTHAGNVDQPHTQAQSAAGQDRLYVGFNNGFGCLAPNGRSATLDVSQNASGAAAFTLDVIESRNTACQDGFAQVPAPHPDGTVYAAFLHDWNGSPRLVVVRDDAFGTGGFTALLDPGDSKPGRFVTAVLTLPAGTMGQNRLGASNVSIAVDPRSSDRVYVAYGDSNGLNSESIHVRRSIDRGQTWSADLLTVAGAMNPEVAINSAGVVGVLYQRVVANRWKAQFTRTTNADATAFDAPGLLLANTDATAPGGTFSPYIGDYASLIAAGTDFFGMFSASNFPDPANFLPGVVFQRYVDWTAHKLYADAAHTTEVAPSIDPYFFEVDAGPQIQVPGGLQLGDVCVGKAGAGTLNVCNTGQTDLVVSGIASSSPSVAVTTPSSGFPVTISHDFCFPFQVALTPAAAGPQAATLTISSNDSKAPSTVVQVAGTGGRPDIRVTGSTDFGVASAWTPAEKTVAVCNTGGCNLSVTAAAVGCADFTLINDPFPAKVSPGSCLALTVGFTPHQPGFKSCSLTVASDDPDAPLVSRTLTARTPPLFSLHAGLVDPHGALHAIAKQGSTVNLDFVYPFQPKWAWDVRLGASRFDGRAGQPDTSLANLSANARFTATGAPVHLFLNGGLGLYHFNPGTFEGGGNLGIGLNVPAGPRFAVEATYNHHWAFTASPTLAFSQVQLGFLVSF